MTFTMMWKIEIKYMSTAKRLIINLSLYVYCNLNGFYCGY